MSRSDKSGQKNRKKKNSAKSESPPAADSHAIDRVRHAPSPPPRAKGFIWLRVRQYLATSTSFQRASAKIGRARSRFLPNYVCKGATRMPLLSCMLCITPWLLGPRDTYIIFKSANPTANRDLPASVCAMTKKQAYTRTTVVRFTAGFVFGVASIGRITRADSMSSIRKQNNHRVGSLVLLLKKIIIRLHYNM